MITQDVSYDFRYNPLDAKLAKKILVHEGTKDAILDFNKYHKKLSDYAYWFFLSTLWVSYTGWSDLNLWIKLFSSDRPNRKTSIMKPSEIAEYDLLYDYVTCFRAHRPGETNWIAYTTDCMKAAKFAAYRNIDSVSMYSIHKKDILAYFTRRGESEIICLDKNKARFLDNYKLEIRRGELK